MGVNSGRYLPTLRWVIVLVRTTQKPKQLVYFCRYTEKWLEINLLTCDVIYSAAWSSRWVVFVSHFLTSQSARATSKIHLSGIYWIILLVEIVSGRFLTSNAILSLPADVFSKLDKLYFMWVLCMFFLLWLAAFLLFWLAVAIL